MIVWIDLETTGLDPDVHSIIEVAMIITDDKYNEVRRYHALIMEDMTGPEIKWDPFALSMHVESGLYEQWLRSYTHISVAETDIVHLIHKHVNTVNEKPRLGGQSVHFDRTFLKNYMPSVEDLLSHRHVDVTSIKYFCSMLNEQPDRLPPIKSETTHRAMEDIEASLDAIKYYTDNVMGVVGANR